MIITLDFESFYDSEYSLSKLSTEQYIRDPRFEVIGCGVSVNGAPSRWYSGKNVEVVLKSLPWKQASLLAFNTAFDGAILAWVYGIYPALYLDAMGMAKACGKTYRGASLSSVATLLSVGKKGDYIIQAKGKRLKDFLPHELAAYGSYCCQDVDLTIEIFKTLRPHFPQSETRIQDLNLRLFIEPLLQFDVHTLHAYHKEVVEQKQEQQRRVAEVLGLDWDGNTALLKTQLASNPRFAALLEAQSIDPPKKISPKTGKETFAFAKTDPEFMELLEHDDPTIQSLVSARLGVRSTIEETRAERFIDISNRGSWPVQYNYYGANTSRFSGAGSANPQNLKRGGTLRDAILPPAGHAIIAGDLGAIECRWINYLAGQDDIVEAFREYDAGRGPDVYCILAEKIFRCPVSKGDTEKRMPAKTAELALGFGGGWKAYKRALFQQAGILITQYKSQEVVDIYRDSHQKVQKFWKSCDDALAAMLRGEEFTLGREGVLVGTKQGILLPNGLYLSYPELRREWDDQKKETAFKYTKQGKPKVIYGATVAQNLAEALARLTLTDAWLRLADRIRIVFHLHDELTGVVPFADVEWAMQLMHEEMVRPIPWAPGLPIACEVKCGHTYGEARR